MQHKYACYRPDRSFICDVMASTEKEAMIKAKLEDPDAVQIILVCNDNSLGVQGVN